MRERKSGISFVGMKYTPLELSYLLCILIFLNAADLCGWNFRTLYVITMVARFPLWNGWNRKIYSMAYVCCAPQIYSAEWFESFELKHNTSIRNISLTQIVTIKFGWYILL